MSPRISRVNRARKLTWWRRAAGFGAIVFLLLTAGVAHANIRISVIGLLISAGVWAMLKGAQFIVARRFIEQDVGVAYTGQYAVVVGWVMVGLGILFIGLGVLGLVF